MNLYIIFNDVYVKPAINENVLFWSQQGGDNGKMGGHVECMGEQLEDQGIDGRILNWILKEQVVRVWSGFV